jgi:nucleoside-diphosphate-sugar epimerase
MMSLAPAKISVLILGATGNVGKHVVDHAPVEAPSKGEIVPVDRFPSGSVTFVDMGLFLVKLAHGAHRADVLGKAVKPFYATPVRNPHA